MEHRTMHTARKLWLSLAAMLALLTTTSTTHAQTFTIDFQAINGQPSTLFQGVPADAFSAQGVASLTVNSAFTGILFGRISDLNNFALAHANFTQTVNATFSQPVVSVTVDVLDIGVGGVILEAFNASNTLVDSHSVSGAGRNPLNQGIGNVDELTVEGAGIVRLVIRQPSGDDGFLVDNLRFTRAVCGDGTRAPTEACDDGNTNPCDGCNATCTAVDVVGCFIGGSCVANGALNPSNACQVCDRAEDNDAYVSTDLGSVCSDGQFCTLTEACDGNGACVVSQNRSCNDNLSCTNDSCDEVNNECDNDLTTGCIIGGACVASGARDLSDCRACVPGTSTTSYVNVAATTSCDDGQFCTIDDACNGSGQCIPSGARDCSDPLACTQDGCNELTNACEHPVVDGCLIAGQCVTTDTNNPTNNCQACIPTASRSAYSAKAAQSPCDDGLFCTVDDACNGSSVCLGGTRDCNDQRTCTTDSCDEGSNQCDHDLTSGCLIGGVCIAENTNNPASECQACVSGTSTSAYSNKPTTADCNDGQFCTTTDKCDGNGACAAGPARNCDDGLSCTTDSCDEDEDRCARPVTMGCRINNTCIADGTINPSNPCQVCNAGLNQTDWSPTALGATCDDGLFCTAIDGCNGAGSCVGTARDCADAFSCTQDICNDTTDACENPLVAGCVINGACVPEGQDDPQSACRECVPSVSTSAYSNRAEGDRCGDPSCMSGTQTPAPTCDDSGECVVHPPMSCNGAQCADAVSCTGTCTGDMDCLESHYCAPNGMCVPDGDDGSPCARGDMCESGHCADGVCCDSECRDICEACNQAGSIGMCTPYMVGTDPMMECGPGQVCSGASMCVDQDLPPGVACTDNLQCASNYCVDGVCCDGLCNGTCESCAVVDHLGMCTPFAIGEDPQNECGDGSFCNGASQCASYETRGSGVLCSASDMNEETRRAVVVMLLLLLVTLLNIRRRSV